MSTGEPVVIASGPIGAGGLLDSARNFAALASTGQFEVSAEGGQALLAVIDNFTQEIRDQAHHLQGIATAPPLGRLSGGAVMSPFMVQVATDDRGFIPRFQELRASLIQAREAIVQAMASYRATDEEIRLSLSASSMAI